MERQLVLVPPKFKVEQIENIQTQYDSLSYLIALKIISETLRQVKNLCLYSTDKIPLYLLRETPSES
jgi:hypothetical protein